MKTQVAVLYGGKSCEHEVSIITALQAMDALDTTKYDVVPIYFAHDGRLMTGDKLRDVDFYKNFDPSQVTQVLLAPREYDKGARLIRWPVRGGLFGGVKTVTILDVALLCFHGLNGEDGTVQGMLELVDLPYTSAGLGGSAMGMDKIAMKLAFQGMGLPALPMVWFDRDRYEKEAEKICDEIEEKLPYPVYVKPANLGSSIGISRAQDRASLQRAIEVAVHYDRRILVEQGLDRPIEVNCSALGFGSDVRASVCEMPAQWQEFLTYEDKYLRGGKNAQSQGMAQLSRQIPAPIGDEMTKRVQEMAVKVFKTFDLKGVVRIDFMIDRKTNALFVGEVNTIPGSLAFYLWEPLGLSFGSLLDEMIEKAFYAQEEKEKQEFTYNSRILSQFGSKAGKLGTKGGKFGGKLVK